MDQEIAVVFDGDGDPEERITVNPVVLALASPVFKSILTQNMAAQKSCVIELRGKDPDEFKVLVSFLMPASSRRQSITEKNVDFLLRWADEYCIEPLREECVAFVRQLPPTVERVLQVRLGPAWPTCTCSSEEADWAYAFGIEDHLEFCVKELVEVGEVDWGSCLKDAELMKILITHFMNFNRDRTKEVKDLRNRLKRGHVHTGGVLQDGHKLECGKCENKVQSVWQCQRCMYSA
mmetsp:Transcript_123576/g.395287  ORF Transcript_123576/g.395287 Transcript_123576/m.395287 type:complete len:235 (-) Transcript_123576:416-1120(-)